MEKMLFLMAILFIFQKINSAEIDLSNRISSGNGLNLNPDFRSPFTAPSTLSLCVDDSVIDSLRCPIIIDGLSPNFLDRAVTASTSDFSCIIISGNIPMIYHSLIVFSKLKNEIILRRDCLFKNEALSLAAAKLQINFRNSENEELDCCCC